MKKLILMIAVALMAFTASFAQDRQHTDQARNNDRATRTNSYHSSHRYRSQSRIHHMRTRRHHRNYDRQ